MKKIKIAYITSSAYSGSTLLSFILNSHPQIGTISEYDVMTSIKSDREFLCSCGEPIRKCEFFSSLKNKLNVENMPFELDDMNLMFNIFKNERINRYFTQKLPLVHSTFLERVRENTLQLIPGYTRFMTDMHKRNMMFMRSVLELKGASVFLDANKNPYRVTRLSEKHEVLPIYLYKNGIGGAYSFYTRAKHINSNMSFKKACNDWFIEQITINRVISIEQSTNILNISYSELCRDTQNTANKIFEFCGLSHQDISTFSDSEHHIIGNAMRIKKADKIIEKTDWKKCLSQKDVDTYKRVYDHYMPKLLSYNSAIEQAIWYS